MVYFIFINLLHVHSTQDMDHHEDDGRPGGESQPKRDEEVRLAYKSNWSHLVLLVFIYFFISSIQSTTASS